MSDREQRARELLPCPFCGRYAVIEEVRGAQTMIAHCADRLCGSVVGTSEAHAAMRWNTRALTPSPPSEDEVERVAREVLGGYSLTNGTLAESIDGFLSVLDIIAAPPSPYSENVRQEVERAAALIRALSVTRDDWNAAIEEAARDRHRRLYEAIREQAPEGEQVIVRLWPDGDWSISNPFPPGSCIASRDEILEEAASAAEKFADDDCDLIDRFQYGYTTAANSIASAILALRKPQP